MHTQTLKRLRGVVLSHLPEFNGFVRLARFSLSLPQGRRQNVFEDSAVSTEGGAMRDTAPHASAMTAIVRIPPCN